MKSEANLLKKDSLLPVVMSQSVVDQHFQRKYKAICNLIAFSEGSFSLALVLYDFPSTLNNLLDRLHQHFLDLNPKFNLVHIVLHKPSSDASSTYHVLDQIKELVTALSPQRPPDALLITGYETFFPTDLTLPDETSHIELRNAIQPLNFGRNLLKEANPYPVLLFLPEKQMSVFLRHAHDLTSWRSGYFEFLVDKKQFVDLINTTLNNIDVKKLQNPDVKELQADGINQAILDTLLSQLLAWQADVESDELQLPLTCKLKFYLCLGTLWLNLNCSGGALAAFDRGLALAKQWQRLTTSETNETTEVKQLEENNTVETVESQLEQLQKKAAEKFVAPKLSLEQQQLIDRLFRGAQPLTTSDVIYGRDAELDSLFNKIKAGTNLFLIVEGYKQCGKTSFIAAGIVPALQKSAHFLPVIVNKWDKPASTRYAKSAVAIGQAAVKQIKDALAREVRALSIEADFLNSFDTTPLYSCLRKVYEKTQKAIVIICDQFEDFFSEFDDLEARVPLINEIGRCYEETEIPCCFLLVIGSEHLGYLREFSAQVADPLAPNRLFHLSHLRPAMAITVLTQLTIQANLTCSSEFIQFVVNDLIDEHNEGRINLVDLQLVALAIVGAKITEIVEYVKQGRKAGLKKLAAAWGFKAVVPSRKAVVPFFRSKFLIPYQRNHHFTGRETELAKIDQALATQGQMAIQALAGLGGIGKTATAIEYAYRHQENHPDEHIFWVLADSDINIDNSFVTIADELKLPRPNDQKPEDTVKQVQAWLKDNSNWLVIFDNLENIAMLRKYLPALAKGKVLITTRLANTGHFASIEIEKFSDADSVEFLLKRAKITAPTANDQKFAAKLVQELDGLPLAIEQAGAYIAENQLSIQEYLQLYQEERSALLAQPSDSSTHDTVTVTFKPSFDKLKETDPVAANLLRFMAFLAPNAIPEEIFKFSGDNLIENLQVLQRAATSSLSWIKVYSAATRYSLIKRDATSKSFSIHRLVQLVIRETLAEDEQRQWLESVVTVLAVVSQDPDKIENWPLCARLVPHQQMLFEHIQEYQLFNEASGAMLNQAGYYLQAQGQYQQAEPLYLEALEIRKQVLGTNHPDYATSLNNLANLYREQGRYEQAAPLSQQALEITKQVLGTNHPDYAQSLNNLATLYKSQGRYEQAEPLYLKGLEIRKQVQGTDHPDYATSLNNLANLYRARGRYEEAEPLYLEVLEIRKQVQGTDHPSYATSLNNLANLYYNQGRYEQAAPLYQQSLEITKQVLGTNHPDYATSLGNLAGLYESQGRYEQAEPFYLEALEILKQVLGTTHPDYATSLNNLANLYYNQGRYEQAAPLSQQALEITKQVLGTLHPDYATSLNNLANLYREQGRYEQAEPLYQQASEVYKQVLGTFHPAYATSLNNLANLYREQGRYEQAEPLYQQASEVYKQVLGMLHPDYATNLNNLANLYRARGRYEEAEPLMKEASEIFKQVLGTNHPAYATSLNNLGLLYQAQGRYEEAELLLKKA
jgi:tetratricopeptide (TPR) repeat protein